MHMWGLALDNSAVHCKFQQFQIQLNSHLRCKFAPIRLIKAAAESLLLIISSNLTSNNDCHVNCCHTNQCALYRPRAQDVAQEMEGKYATADVIAWPGLALLGSCLVSLHFQGDILRTPKRIQTKLAIFEGRLMVSLMRGLISAIWIPSKLTMNHDIPES